MTSEWESSAQRSYGLQLDAPQDRSVKDIILAFSPRG